MISGVYSQKIEKLSFIDIHGNSISRDTTRTTFLYVWAPYCGPCKNALPYINNLHKSHPESLFLAVSDKATDEEIKISLEHFPINFPVVKYSESFFKLIGQYNLPSYIIITKEGLILKTETIIKEEFEKNLKNKGLNWNKYYSLKKEEQKELYYLSMYNTLEKLLNTYEFEAR